MYAIVEINGQQFKAEAGKKLVKGLQERRDWKKEQLLGWLGLALALPNYQKNKCQHKKIYTYLLTFLTLLRI